MISVIQILADKTCGEIVGDTVRVGHFTISCGLTGAIILSSNLDPGFRTIIGYFDTDPEIMAHSVLFHELVWR